MRKKKKKRKLHGRLHYIERPQINDLQGGTVIRDSVSKQHYSNYPLQTAKVS